MTARHEIKILQSAAYIISLLLLISTGAIARPTAVSVEGVVYDSATAKPLPFVTVQVVGASRSTIANDDGHFRLLLEPGSYELKFSHIGYLTNTLAVTISDGSITKRDAYLQPTAIYVGEVTVYGDGLNEGQRLIAEAIKRKRDILEHVHDYRFDAYTKLVVRDISKPDSVRIMLITETQTSSFWERPAKYKEVILARQQSKNVGPEGNLVTVGEILNFNKNRIDFGRYAIVSPTAEDALDNYDYYLKDTLMVDGRRIFRLAIEPKDENQPRFIGTISIADSTYDVVEVDVGVSKGVEIPFVSELRYRQRFARLQGEYWMPIEIVFSGQAKISFPGIPPRLSFEHHASLYDYAFDQGLPKGTFGEYELEVLPQADKFDSSEWQSRQTIPLSLEELRGYHLIDSAETRGASFGKKALMVSAAVLGSVVFGGADFFHFNRVEGPYLGLTLDLEQPVRNLDLWAKGGYAFDARSARHVYGFNYRLSERQRLWAGAEYRKQVAYRASVIGDSFDPTLDVLLARDDPYDYFQEKGFRVFASGKLFNFTTLISSYADFAYRSIGVNTDYSLASRDKEYRANPGIEHGRVRSVTTELSYDSRKRFRNKGRDRLSYAPQYTLLSIGAEYSSPSLLASDFDYRRVWVSAKRRQRLGDWGIATIEGYAGSSDRALPPQRYFKAVGASGVIADNLGYPTLAGRNISGSRIATVVFRQEFRRAVWQKSGLPLIKNIPFYLSLHGGATWSDFRTLPQQPDGKAYLATAKPYTELGFGLSNLTPFLSVFNFAAYFTWQLSDYDTKGFNFVLGLEL